MNPKQRKTSLKDLKLLAHKKLGAKCSNPACQWLNPDGSRGCTDSRCLQIDHTRGGGYKDRVEKGHTGRALYKAVLEDQEDTYQLLCANCNWIKRVENKEEGH